MSADGVEVIPSANRLIHSLRDMGYEFHAAVADIVDNSIEARANAVRIDVVWNGQYSYVAIADNGTGMSAAELREAMRFGADRDYDAEDLGKFGLGLKTASMSQCTRLTVASRQNPSRADINAYKWDLAHIKATNRWEILPVPTASLPKEARQHLKETTGSVVVWERLDRIVGFRNPDGEHARKHLIALCRELEEHLAMVFHRFLGGEVRGKKLSIYLNNNKVVPWDPFARGESATQKLDAVVIRVETEASRGDLVLEPYVLPPQGRFSSPEAHARASGPAKWNRQQGFYIYRADRMIQSGGWSNIRTLDEHLKLARVALSFSPKLDEAFKINVAKMRVSLPSSIRDEVAKAIGPLLRLANSAYREKSGHATPRPSTPPQRTPAQEDWSLRPPTSDIGIGEQTATPPAQSRSSLAAPNRPRLNGTDVDDVQLDQVEALLVSVASPEELPVVKSVVAKARASVGASAGA